MHRSITQANGKTSQKCKRVLELIFLSLELIFLKKKKKKSDCMNGFFITIFVKFVDFSYKN